MRARARTLRVPPTRPRRHACKRHLRHWYMQRIKRASGTRVRSRTRHGGHRYESRHYARTRSASRHRLRHPEDSPQCQCCDAFVLLYALRGRVAGRPAVLQHRVRCGPFIWCGRAGTERL
jgi:hypothetical protein